MPCTEEAHTKRQTSQIGWDATHVPSEVQQWQTIPLLSWSWQPSLYPAIPPPVWISQMDPLWKEIAVRVQYNQYAANPASNITPFFLGQKCCSVNAVILQLLHPKYHRWLQLLHFYCSFKTAILFCKGFFKIGNPILQDTLGHSQHCTLLCSVFHIYFFTIFQFSLILPPLDSQSTSASAIFPLISVTRQLVVWVLIL